MTVTPENETETTQTPEQMLTDLGEFHMRTLVSPLPKHPAAMGWQATAGSMAAGFARALHALNDVDPARAQDIVTWFQGPFEDEGPDPEEHTDWLEHVVAKGDLALVERWIQDGRRFAESSKAATDAREAPDVQAAERWRAVEPLITEAHEKNNAFIDTNDLAAAAGLDGGR